MEKFERTENKKRLGETPDAMVKLTNIKHTWENEVQKEMEDEFVNRSRPKTASEYIGGDFVCEPALETSETGFVFAKKPEKPLNAFQQSEKEKLERMTYEHYSEAIPECVKIPPMPVYVDRSKIGSAQGGKLRNTHLGGGSGGGGSGE